MAMGKVMWQTTMSLDGFIAGRDDAMDWVFENGQPSALADELFPTVGAILAGRRSYDVDVRIGEPPYGGAWKGPEFVLTHHPPASADREGLTFLDCSIEDAVATAREAAGEKTVVVFGANVARQVLEAGLLDEVVLHQVPVLLGGGVPLYSGDVMARLELVSVTQSGQQVDLVLRPAH